MQRVRCCTISSSCNPASLIIQARTELECALGTDAYYYQRHTFKTDTDTLSYNLCMSDEGHCVMWPQYQRRTDDRAVAAAPSAAEGPWIAATAPNVPELIASSAWVRWMDRLKQHQAICPAGYSVIALKMVIFIHLSGVCMELLVDETQSSLQQLESHKARHVRTLRDAIARMVDTFQSVCVHNVVRRTADPVQSRCRDECSEEHPDYHLPAGILNDSPRALHVLVLAGSAHTRAVAQHG
jgi:hypothetical protein